MELKQHRAATPPSIAQRSNRTFMELKQVTSFADESGFAACSNRTFMELKPLNCIITNCVKFVLIVPLWN